MTDDDTMTFGEALRTMRCPKCGAEPGEDCRDSTPLPSGMHRVHTQRVLIRPAPMIGEDQR